MGVRVGRRRESEGSADGGRIRAAGLVRTKNGLLESLEHLARESLAGQTLWDWAQLEDARGRVRAAERRTSQQCRDRGLAPTDLPTPSRRAYQLLSFLATDGWLEAHVRTLQTLYTADARVESRLDHGGIIYRFERSGGRITLQVSEGFVGAPFVVLQSLTQLAVPYTRKRGPREIVRAYAEGPDFAQVLRAIEASGGADELRTEGSHYDLADVFDSVNRKYFGGRLSPPRMLWTSRVTFREFGHYEPATDTVRVSRTLDTDGVPAFVLEQVMHHELLHRVMGAEERNGRRRYHTAGFRRAEREFDRLSEADAFLRELARRGGR